MKYITSDTTGISGVGHKFHSWVLGLILSRYCNVEYIYSSLDVHFRNEPIIDSDWNTFLNFNSKFKSNANVNNIIELPYVLYNDYLTIEEELDIEESTKEWVNIIQNSEDNTLFKIPAGQFVKLFQQDIYNLNHELQSYYWENKTPYNFNNNKLNIVLHIRRGDLFEESNDIRWISSNTYIEIMDKLRKKYNDVVFHILSEEKHGHINIVKKIKKKKNIESEKQFADLKKEDTIFYINECDLTSFHMMCSADILVTGASAFSILASYLNNNAKEIIHTMKL